MNIYKKYAPKVFLAECEEQHEKGDEIIVETRYGKENECIVWNLIYEKDGKYYYSITRSDGFDSQAWAKRKAKKLSGYASNAEKKSDSYYEQSQEGKDFLVLAEPIKIGHHSEKRHRALIERNHVRMGKSIESGDKAKEYERRAEYWGKRKNDIDLSMPESIDYYEHVHGKAAEYHEGLKSGKYPKQHSFDIQYANKARKTALKNHEMAQKLWS